VGLIQRVIEAAGISTISITLSKEITRKVRPPRAVFTGFPLGHPVGYPGESRSQLETLRVLLSSLETIDLAGTIVEPDLKRFRR